MQVLFENYSKIIVYLPLLPFFIFPLIKELPENKKTFHIKLMIIIMGIFVVTPPLTIFGVFDITYIIALICLFYFYYREVSSSLYKKVFWFFTTCLLGCFSILFSVIVDAYMNPYIQYSDYSFLRICVQFIFIVICDCILYYPIQKYYTWIFDHFHNDKAWQILCFFPIALICISFILIPQHFDFVLRYRYFKIFLFIIILFFLLILLIYILLYHIIHNFVMNHQIMIENNILMIQANQYNQLLSHIQQTRRIRHDFKHQIIVISELLNQKEYEKLEEYIHKTVSMVSTEMIQYCYSSAVNATLSHYESLCHDKNIKTDFKVSLPKEIPISEIDLCVLLGNLLENAFDACQQTQNPYITLKLAKTSPSILALKVSNPYTHDIIEKNGKLLSTKDKGQGIGIESIQIISKKYHGITDIQYDNHIFSVKVLLKF